MVVGAVVAGEEVDCDGDVPLPSNTASVNAQESGRENHQT